ncbi:hypothetical protein JMUB7554_27850 [Staphylococcus aureus]
MCIRDSVFFQAEDGIRDRSVSRGLGDVYKRQAYNDQIVAANAKVKNYKVTPEGIYLIDYRTTIER